MLVDALRARNAERVDPVALRFVEALARRATDGCEAARAAVRRRLAQAVSNCHERLDAAGRAADDVFARGAARFPDSVGALQQYREAGDVAGLHCLLARLEGQGAASPLGGLLDHIGRDVPESAGGSSSSKIGAPPPVTRELKSLSYFRSTWSRLSLERQLSEAFAQAPENAGPLNSHHLVLQALGQMRDISPEYLREFMSYVDALQWLEQADNSRIPARNSTVRKSAARGEREKKRR
ncbi:putative protein DUF2894 [Aromatoleum petrolei]|nr:putative protein DUF2894 [Aromatoleum petrolei]